jgi:hypothetical protein
MTDSTSSAYPTAPALAARGGVSLWTPGMQLLQRLSPRAMALWLWASLCLPALAALLWPRWLPNVQGALDAGAHPAAAALLLVLVLLGSLYLVVCAGKLLSESLELLQRGAADLGPGVATPSPADGSIGGAFGRVQLALERAGAQLAQLRQASQQGDALATRSARELDEVRTALQLQHQDMRAAVGELARRTVALCGMLDSDRQDAESANADLEAIQDEERNVLQLMAALRGRLLALAGHCQALGPVARGAGASAGPDGAAASEGDPAGAELAQCHQLSERIGTAERMNDRRIESMRRSMDRLLCRAERGMVEGQQLMMLTRQAQAALAESLQQLQRMATQPQLQATEADTQA